MSTKYPKSQATQKARLQYIRKNILFKTYDEMAEELHVAKNTIFRDVRTWWDQGGFDDWLQQQFFELYGQEKITLPSRALDRVLILLTRKLQREEKLFDKELKIELWRPTDENSDSLQSARRTETVPQSTVQNAV